MKTRRTVKLGGPPVVKLTCGKCRRVFFNERDFECHACPVEPDLDPTSLTDEQLVDQLVEDGAITPEERDKYLNCLPRKF